MRAMSGTALAGGGIGERPLRAVGRLARRLEAQLPRRARRWAERVKRSPRSAGHRFSSWALAAIALSAFASGDGLRILGDAALVGAGFGIGEIRFTGNRETPELDLLIALETDGRAMLLFDADAARERVAALPWIETVSIRKFYPATLEVKLSERRAFALWQNAGATAIVDAGGRPIVPFEDRRFARLPLVVGAGAAERAGEYVRLLAATPQLKDRVEAGILVAKRRWDLRLADGIEVRLPETGADAALAAFARLDADARFAEREVRGVDLRIPGQAAIRLEATAAETMRKAWDGRMTAFRKAEAAL